MKGELINMIRAWDRSQLNSLNDLILHEFSYIVAQLRESPPGVWEIMGLIPVGDSDVFFVPRSCHVDQFTFHEKLP